MSAQKVYRYLIGLFILGLGLSFFIVRYAGEWLSKSSEELTVLRTEVSDLEKKRSLLEKGKQILSSDEPAIATLAKVLPEDKDQARVIQEIKAIADQANITIDSVGFPSSTLGSEAPKPAPAPATDQNTQAQQTQPTATASVSQATPVKEIPGVQSIEVTLGAMRSKNTTASTGVRYDEMITLLKGIERNRRTMQIESIGISQNAGIDSYTLSLSLIIYIKP